MKFVTKTILTGALLTGAMVSSAAMAAQKIGLVNVELIFQQMPQTALVQQTIDAEFKDQRAAMAQMQEDINYLINKRQREAATMSETEIKELEGKIITMRDEFNAKAQPLQQKMQQRLSEERQKIGGLINNAIQAIAAEDNYDLVLQGQAAAFVKPEYNISEKVLERVSKAN